MRALLAAGGTGGHMFPAQALAEHLKSEGWDIAMMTDARGKKHAGNIPADPIIEVLAASITPRKPHKVPAGAFKLVRGIMQAKRFIKHWKPDVVIGFGGYPAFPAIWAAQSLKIPTVLHEQNAVLGRVNRVFAAKATHVVSGFEMLHKLPKGSNWTCVGNPMRAAVMDVSNRKYTPPKRGPINLLVVGGSLGSSIVSTVTAQAVCDLPRAMRKRLNIVQQTRAADMDAVTALYKDAGIKAECQPFFSNIQDHLSAAHFIIARAGASSVSEIALMGLPSLLVPLAIAMDDHQTINAQTLIAIPSDNGNKAAKNLDAADILPESLFTPQAVKNILWERLSDSTYLETASRAARSTSKPDATHRLASLVKSAIGA